MFLCLWSISTLKHRFAHLVIFGNFNVLLVAGIPAGMRRNVAQALNETLFKSMISLFQPANVIQHRWTIFEDPTTKKNKREEQDMFDVTKSKMCRALSHHSFDNIIVMWDHSKHNTKCCVHMYRRFRLYHSTFHRATRTLTATFEHLNWINISPLSNSTSLSVCWSHLYTVSIFDECDIERERTQLSQSNVYNRSETTADVSIRLFIFQLINFMKCASRLQPMVEPTGWIYVFFCVRFSFLYSLSTPLNKHHHRWPCISVSLVRRFCFSFFRSSTLCTVLGCI